MQWCDGCKGCDSNEENDISDAMSDAKMMWVAEVSTKLAQVDPKFAQVIKFAPNGPPTGASWPQLGPSQLQVSPS